MNFDELVECIGTRLRSNLPTTWDAKACIRQMKDAGSANWRQMEWIGFYFEFLCNRYLSDIMQIPGPAYGRPRFDGFLEFPWDFKAHAINTSSHNVVVNDSTAVAEAIKEYGAVGLILALGQVQYNDENRSFQHWHENLKGGPSRYTENRIARGAWSRLRKVRFDLKQVCFVQLTDETLVRCGSFQEGFRNSDGTPRRRKVLMDLESLGENEVRYLDF